MNLRDLLLDPVAPWRWRSGCCPCALQDYWTRHVANWLPLPLFILAWPVALLTGNLPPTLAVLAGVFLAWQWSVRLIPADGKIAVGLAGFSPPALIAGVIVQGLAFLYARLRDKQPVRLPGAVGFYFGAVIATLVRALLK